MFASDQEDQATYTVVVNHEEQYSIWLDGREVPAGWSEVGVVGSKSECLDHIERVWTDMRPLSLRRRLAQRDGD
ncbi:MbtH family NRPS accessory protein [Dactylosporangium roseum]|uniref:MbtH family NRPS accessory protein n=1 Tax=Dactylosporangium roseum TaxID=47989 RepID=A0ABY5ZBJ3_9ACTN|nr:MbtH family NRPS accessory protein [Dactylosporangium roseum]UWZ39401.1 MbtH family NRPS accessory protein [Dactylosporangium roseum]